MIEKKESFNLLDLIDVNFLQEFQDICAKVMGVASLIYDTEKAVTKPSYFTDFCRYTRSSKLGQSSCEDCDIKWGKAAAEKGKPIVYKCHTGLTDFVVPFMLNGQHIGSFFGGQILTQEPDEESFRQIARSLALNEDEYIEALRKIKIIPKEKVEEFVKLLFLVANTLSTIANKNFEMRRKNTRELLYRKITETIRSSLDIGETKEKIVEVVGKTLNADRCFIVEFDKNTDRFLNVNDEYLASPDIQSYKGVDTNEDVPVFAEALKAGKTLIIKEKEIYLDNEVQYQNLEKEREAIERLNVQSAFAFSLFFNEEFLGLLSIHYVNENKTITTDEIDLIKILANQIALAIYHAKLYKRMLLKAEREKLIADIMVKSLSSFEESQFSLLVSEVCQLMNADRCFFVEIDEDKRQGQIVPLDNQYLASDDIKPLGDFDFAAEDISMFMSRFLKIKDVVGFDYEQARSELGEDADFNRYSTRFDLKSGIAIPFFYENKLTAVIAIEYVKQKFIPTADELDFLRILGNHVGLIFNQKRLYEKAKAVAERETILRRIIEVTRSSMDIREVKHNILKELCDVLNADRCFFRAYDKIQDRVLAPEIEYLSTSGVQSLLNSEPPQEAVQYFLEEAKKQKRLFYPTIATLESTKGTATESYLLQSDIKADYAIPITDIKDELMWLVLHFTKKDPKLSEDDKKLLETIAYHIDIAFSQIKLYETSKKEAEREGLLRRIYEAMRSSLNINSIKNKIVTEVGKVLEADICFMFLKSDCEDCFYVDEFSEYRASQDDISRIGFDIKQRKAKMFLEAFNNKDDVNFSNDDEFIKKNNLKGTPEGDFIKEYKIKSGYHVPIYYANTLLGYLILNYTKSYRNLCKDELELVNTIATQSGIALHQAKLFKITNEQAEREKISRNIIEIVRSTLDKALMKHLFVKAVGEFFHADRVLFSEYDEIDKMYLPVEMGAEYLSSKDEKSFVGYDWSHPSSAEYIGPLLEKKELNIPNWENYIEKNPKSHDFISMFEDANVKSSYNMPVLYQQRIMGYFCIEFTKEYNELPDEDINLIRSICRQAGIALYQAELLKKAQETAKINAKFAKSITDKVKESLKNIIDFSEVLSKIDIEQVKQQEYINQINLLSKNLLDMVNEFL